MTEFEATLNGGVFTEFVFTANTVLIVNLLDGTQGEIPLRFSVDSNFEGRLESALSGFFEPDLSGPFVQIPEPSNVIMMLMGSLFFLRRTRQI